MDKIAPPDAPAPVVTFVRRPRDVWGHVRAALPVAAAGIAWAVHVVVPNALPKLDEDYFAALLLVMLAASGAVWVLQALVKPVRPMVRHLGPLVAAALLTLCAWDLLTLKFNLLPPLYVPAPYRVLWVFALDWRDLFWGLLYSLANLLTGYAAGALVGLVCGIAIGWSPRVRYWGMPLLKLVGPLPATAWIPLAIILAPTAFCARAGLIAMAVWFPVAMLAASGIANVERTYLDVARTLGASRWFLIFRVAIPAALPSIFLGLFMGLGTSFLTLIAAEAVGSQNGLGFYFLKAKESMEYPKIWAALIVLSVFFSLVMTGLFRLRDRVLIWQKGVIKW
jgi:NitT/TauT family transport system permease protein